MCRTAGGTIRLLQRIGSIGFLVLAFYWPVSAQTGTITEWLVPTPNSLPLHIVAASDTLTYFTESGANKVAQFDTTTNTFTEWKLPGGSLPHGIILSSGTVVLCAIDGNYVGFLDPDTSHGTAWFLPTPGSGPGHLDISGTSFFITEANGNRIGLLNPGAATITEWTIPTANSNPWGIAVGQGTQVFFVERAAQKIAMLDTSVNTITEWSLTTKQVEHLRFSEGSVYFGDLGSNVVATLNPVTNVVSWWQVPTASAGIPDVFVSSGMINFTERRGNKIGLLDPLNGTTETVTPVVTSVSPATTTVRSESGQLEPSINVGTPNVTVENGMVTGVFTEWEVPTVSSQPFGISVIDNIVFFTEYSGDTVATLTTSP